MKTSSLPSLHINAEMREAAERVLRQGETLTDLVEAALREAIHRRQTEAEFLARGLASSADAKRTGAYHAATDVHGELQYRLDNRRSNASG